MWNSRGGWKENQKVIVAGAGVRIVGGLGKNLIADGGGGGVMAFKLLFSFLF